MVRYLTSCLLVLGIGALLLPITGCGEGDTLSSTSDPADIGLTQAELDKFAQDAQKVVGHGGLSGPHYNLNIIGVPKSKSADMTGNNGHRIFVKLSGKTKIMLAEGDFMVLDANGTDGRAEFQLPAPDPENNGITEYSVFGRALGKPGGSATLTTCATDTLTLDEYCSVFSTIQMRTKGKSSFTNISRELLYVYADLDGDGNVERYPLFDDALQDYFWSYDNNGLKLLQLRFYPVPTDVN